MTQNDSNGWPNNWQRNFSTFSHVPKSPLEYIANRLEETRAELHDLDRKVDRWVWRFITAIAALAAATAKIQDLIP